MNLGPRNAVLPAASDTSVPALPAIMTRATPAATAAALAWTLGLAAACWDIAVWQEKEITNDQSQDRDT